MTPTSLAGVAGQTAHEEVTELSDGSTMWWRSVGTGPVLLQVHGSGFGFRNFGRLTPHLAEFATVVDVDLPGYGQSRAAGPVGVAAWAAHLADFVETRHGGDPVAIHGTSMGGLVALSLAGSRPELVSRLVLSCCMMRYDSAARQMRQTWKLAARASGMVAAADLTAVAGFSRAFYDRPDAEQILEELRFGMSSNDPEAFVAGTESLEALDLSDVLHRLEMPTLLIAGTEDNMTPWRPSGSGVGFNTAIEQIPDARLAVLNDSGHYLVLEKPVEAAGLIREFLPA